jgi:diguanylate cyclase (GGDEF)-like protein
MRRHLAAATVRTEQEAEIERRRSRILEKINRTGPLDEILEMVADLASYRLDGAACWCETKDGAVFGRRLVDGATSKVLSEELSAGSGASLGSFHVSPPAAREPGLPEQTALWQGANLASLAIETRRLYADLVRRSEFDVLTEAHTRYYLERELEVLIQLSEGTGGVFGLIYFDLDGFKQVNDSFGHRVGDEYLQKVAARVKGQLRAQDKLARVGGDEFAVLVPLIRSRADLTDIIERLQAALREPLKLEGSVLRSSASFGIAVYPDDGTTREQLLDIADAAMYSSKMAKR